MKNITDSIAVKFYKLVDSWNKITIDEKINFTTLAHNIKDRNTIYSYYHKYFYKSLSNEYRVHRKYFSQAGRGFGEDAFHAMWFKLITEFKPVNCLEIGVYRGQTVSLWALISKIQDYIKINIAALSPFDSSGDTVSIYNKKIDYFEDVISNHGYFDLPVPQMIKAYSTDEDGIKFINSIKWDLIYIDGNHDYSVALQDYQLALKNLNHGGILVMDDSSLYCEYNPRPYAFAGHPGPSKVVIENAMTDLNFICGVGHNNIFMKK